MKRTSAPKRVPPPSGYQKFLRKTQIKLLLLFCIAAAAVGVAIYFYQRHNLIP